MDIKRVAFETRAVASKRPARAQQPQAPQTFAAPAPLHPAPAVAASAKTAGGVNREDIARLVDRFLSGREAAPQTTGRGGGPLPTAQPHGYVQVGVDIEPGRVSPSEGVAPQPEAAPTAQAHAGNGGNGGNGGPAQQSPQSPPAPAPRPAPGPAPQADGGAKAETKTSANGHRAVDFVCEDDVRRAVQKGEKIYVNARTIITPAARDMGEAAEVFAKA